MNNCISSSPQYISTLLKARLPVFLQVSALSPLSAHIVCVRQNLQEACEPALGQSTQPIPMALAIGLGVNQWPKPVQSEWIPGVWLRTDEVKVYSHSTWIELPVDVFWPQGERSHLQSQHRGRKAGGERKQIFIKILSINYWIELFSYISFLLEVKLIRMFITYNQRVWAGPH